MQRPLEKVNLSRTKEIIESIMMIPLSCLPIQEHEADVAGQVVPHDGNAQGGARLCQVRVEALEASL